MKKNMSKGSEEVERIDGVLGQLVGYEQSLYQ